MNKFSFFVVGEVQNRPVTISIFAHLPEQIQKNCRHFRTEGMVGMYITGYKYISHCFLLYVLGNHEGLFQLPKVIFFCFGHHHCWKNKWARILLKLNWRWAYRLIGNRLKKERYTAQHISMSVFSPLFVRFLFCGFFYAVIISEK